MQNTALSEIDGFKVAVYSTGDTLGKSALAKKDALEQGALQAVGSIRAKIYALQASLADCPEVEAPLTHVFAPGVYMRTIFIKAGCVVVGKIHKHTHGNILSQGRVTVVTESGGEEHLQAPLTMVSCAGTKRALVAHTDVVWTTIHVTNATNLDELEKELIAENYADYEQFLLESNLMKKSEVQS